MFHLHTHQRRKFKARLSISFCNVSYHLQFTELVSYIFLQQLICSEPKNSQLQTERAVDLLRLRKKVLPVRSTVSSELSKLLYRLTFLHAGRLSKFIIPPPGTFIIRWIILVRTPKFALNFDRTVKFIKPQSVICFLSKYNRHKLSHLKTCMQNFKKCTLSFSNLSVPRA